MAVAMVVNQQWWDGKRVHVLGTLTFSSTYTTGGDTCTLQSLGIKSSQVPQYVNIVGQTGFQYKWVTGADQTAGKVMIFIATSTATNAPDAQHSQTTIVSGVTGDTITAYMIFTVR